MPNIEKPGWDYRAGDEIQLERVIAELGDYVLPAHSQAFSQANSTLSEVTSLLSNIEDRVVQLESGCLAGYYDSDYKLLIMLECLAGYYDSDYESFIISQGA